MGASPACALTALEKSRPLINVLAHPNHGIAFQHHAQSGTAPQPSMTTSNSPTGPPSLDARRRSLNGASPPNPYGQAPPAHAHQLQASSPTNSRAAASQMLPPSSPPKQHPHASQSQRLSYPTTFGAARDLPGLGQALRQSGGMSISSLIGNGDTGALAHTSQSQSSPAVTAPSSNGHSMQPPSPRRGLPPGTRPDLTSFRRQASPDRAPFGSSNSRHSESHTASVGSPTQRPYSNQGSPDLGRQSLPPSIQSYKLTGFPGQRLFPPGETSRPSSSGIPPRPNSQPTGPAGNFEQHARSPYDTPTGRRNAYGEERRRTLGESHHTRPTAADLLGNSGQSSAERDRAATAQPLSQSAFSPPREHRGLGATSDAPRSLWRHSAPIEAPREAADSRREDHPPPLHRTYGPYPPPGLGGPRYGIEETLRRGVDHLSNRVVEQYHAPPTSDPTSMERHRTEPLARSFSSGGRSSFEGSVKMGEAMQQSKSHIGFSLDATRRTGRASPIPQAVQGAQAQPISIGKDPSIKSEFGRMFSGLGSGIGSSTPTRGSPLPQNGSFTHDPESGDMIRLQRVNSQQGRKAKRVKDEDGGFDMEGADGRATPSSGRGVKRNKHHHHHPGHHQYATPLSPTSMTANHPPSHHHHHHHHHRPGEEQQQQQPVPMGSPPSNGKQASLPQAGPSQPAHHHHHIQGTPHHHHHHHHAPRPTQQPPFAMVKIPTKAHDIQYILEEGSKYPRRHLGSQLYEATTELPKPNSSLDDQFGYASKPKRLPRFEINPINCTFTIRVPRFYLKPRQRQHIVLERHLWGARVYRDDSDPIAAAIHSGWLRGEWDDTVDVAMLDPRITAPNDPSDAEETLSKIPAAPVTPPADMDLQIEILILPQLQEYIGSVEYGISSRKSSGHEGLSFMINKIRWVEEGIGSRGQERTAAALKRRLDASATLLALKSGFDDKTRLKSVAQLQV